MRVARGGPTIVIRGGASVYLKPTAHALSGNLTYPIIKLWGGCATNPVCVCLACTNSTLHPTVVLVLSQAITSLKHSPQAMTETY